MKEPQLKKHVTCEVLHIVTLSLLFGVVIMSGLFAAILFPLMKRMDPTLPEFSAYTEQHWRVAAGRIASLIFLISAWMQSVLYACSLCAFVLAPQGARASRVRRVVVATTTLLLLIVIGVIFVPLQQLLHVYWEFAKQGDMEQAANVQMRFDALHRFATPSMLSLLAGVAACIFFSLRSLWSLVTRNDVESD